MLSQKWEAGECLHTAAREARKSRIPPACVQVLSPSECMYHHVETSIPDDSVLGPGGVSQADSVAGLSNPRCHDPTSSSVLLF